MLTYAIFFLGYYFINGCTSKTSKEIINEIRRKINSLDINNMDKKEKENSTKLTNLLDELELLDQMKPLSAALKKEIETLIVTYGTYGVNSALTNSSIYGSIRSLLNDLYYSYP